MPAKFLRVTVLFVACIVRLATAKAAEITMDPSAGASSRAMLEGTIAAGDFEKVRRFLLSHNNVVELYLASPGGNLGEAIRIGLMIRFLKLSTIVPSKELTNQELSLTAQRHNLRDVRSDYRCTSACFFVFIAGIHRSSEDQGAAILGIHRPFVTEAVIARIGRTRAIQAEEQTRTVIATYLNDMNVQAKYVEDMYSVPRSMIRWIRNDEFQTDFAGFVPQVRDIVEARCMTGIDRTGRGEASGHDRRQVAPLTSPNQLECERKFQDELAHQTYADVIARQGGIPDITLDGKLSAPAPGGAIAPTPPSNEMPASIVGPTFPAPPRGSDYPKALPPTVH